MKPKIYVKTHGCLATSQNVDIIFFNFINPLVEDDFIPSFTSPGLFEAPLCGTRALAPYPQITLSWGTRLTDLCSSTKSCASHA
jgi:hypothetical protein